MTEPGKTNGWSSAEQMVLYRLNQNDDAHEKLYDGINEIKETLAEMKGGSRAKTWLFSTVFPAIIAVSVALLTVLLTAP